MNRCSTGTDRKRQEWIQNGCERTLLKDSKTCAPLGTKGNNYASQQQVPSTATNSNEQWISSNADSNKSSNTPPLDVRKSALSHADGDKGKQNNASFLLGILLPIIVVMTLVMWVFYAYRNPHTKSGQLLIQVRHIF